VVDAAEKERARSSSGSQDGRTVSGDELSAESCSWVVFRESFRFFEDDVVKVSCLGSSGIVFGAVFREGRADESLWHRAPKSLVDQRRARTV
jgi:hypothetical protein